MSKQRTSKGLNYVLALVSSSSSQRTVVSFMDKRLKEAHFSTQTDYEATAEFRNKSFVVSIGMPISEEFSSSNTCTLNRSSFLEDWRSLRQVGQFVYDFCDTATSETLEIILDKKDLESYRLASMIVSFCQDKCKEAVIQDYQLNPIETLYGPPINYTTNRLLFSLLDYTIRHNESPDFAHLKDHHYANLEVLEPADPSGKSRVWVGKEDSKFVTTVYSSIRRLASRGLIKEQVSGTRRRIISIEPTWNGVYAVFFSNFLPDFTRTLYTEESVEDQPTEWEEIR